MRCEEIEILLSAYVDDEVSDKEREIVEQHLQQCSACQLTVAAFSEVHRVYQEELEVKEAPVDFRQRVTQRLEMPFRGWLPWQWPRLVYAVGVFLLIVVGGTIATLSLKQNPLSPSVQQVEQTVEVYAEDILFGEALVLTEDIFAVEDVSVAEGILNTMSFSETET
jgi:anti-sigma factor RsiW